MTILTTWSESGGVGKTTTAFNLSAALGRRGHDVLVVDLDPQPASITDYAGYPGAKTNDEDPNVTDAMLNDDQSIEEVVIEGTYYDLVPGHESLANLESTVRAQQTAAAEFLLRTTLDPLTSKYDFIILDPPATLNLLVDNALIASDEVLIPMEMTRKGKQSVLGVLETVSALEAQLQRAQPDFELSVMGVLANRVSDSKLHREVREELETELDENDIPLLSASIPDYNVMESSWNAQMDIFAFDESDEHQLYDYQEVLLDAYTELAELVERQTLTGNATEVEDEADAESDEQTETVTIQ